MVKKTVRKINTTDGPRFLIGRLDKGEFRPSRFGKEFKTKKGALRALKKKK